MKPRSIHINCNAYMHGMMHGEAFEVGKLPVPVKVAKFMTTPSSSKASNTATKGVQVLC
jgi:hypothetical protein